MIIVGEDQLGSCVQQERAEQVQNPVEPFDQRHAGEDEDGSERKRTEDSPEQNSVLVFHRHLEVAQNQRPDEDVVDTE